MGVNDDVATEIGRVLGTTWRTRNGQMVPTTEDRGLSNGAGKLDAMPFYVGLCHSTEPMS